MRKILLFIITLTIAMTSYAQLTEDFGSGTFPPTGWTSFIGTNGLGTVENWVEDGTTNKYARIHWENVDDLLGPSEDWLVSPQFTVNAATTILSFDNAVFNTADYGGVLTIRVSTTTQTTHADFTTVDTQTELDIRAGATSTVFTTHYVDLAAYAGQAIYVAFVWTQDDSDRLVVDNVEMIADATAPDPVTTPTPADGAVEIYIDPTDGPDADTTPDMAILFDWTPAATGDPATSYEIFLGASALTLNSLGETANDMVNITGMQYSTTYFWRIVAKNVGGSAVNSPIWSFTTAADSSASVEDNVLASSVSIYPNTVTDAFTIKNNSTIALTETTIYDVNGRVVLQQGLNNLIGTKTINVTSLSSGLYFVELKAANAKIVKKIIKK